MRAEKSRPAARRRRGPVVVERVGELPPAERVAAALTHVLLSGRTEPRDDVQSTRAPGDE
jgi:hypothetical protein